MKYVLMALALWVIAGCSGCRCPGCGAGSARPHPTVDVRLVNERSDPITIEARAAGFVRTIELKPGEIWTGLVPRNGIDEFEVRIKP